MTLILTIAWIVLYGFFASTLIWFQCTSRRRKKRQYPPVTLVRQTTTTSPESNYLKNAPSESGLESSVAPYIHANLKNTAEFPEATQSTQSAGADSPIEPPTLPASSLTNISVPIKDKKAPMKDEKAQKNIKQEKPKMKPPVTSGAVPIKKPPAAVPESSRVSPNLKAMKTWEKNMRKEFPEVSDKTQLETTFPTREVSESPFSDTNVTPSPSSQDNGAAAAIEGRSFEKKTLVSNRSTLQTTNTKTKDGGGTATTSIRYISHQKAIPKVEGEKKKSFKETTITDEHQQLRTAKILAETERKETKV